MTRALDVKVILETDRLLKESVEDASQTGAHPCSLFMATTIATSPSNKPPIWSRNCALKNVALEELIIPHEIHDLLRWSGWVRAYRVTAEFFDRRLSVSRKRQ